MALKEEPSSRHCLKRGKPPAPPGGQIPLTGLDQPYLFFPTIWRPWLPLQPQAFRVADWDNLPSGEVRDSSRRLLQTNMSKNTHACGGEHTGPPHENLGRGREKSLVRHYL